MFKYEGFRIAGAILKIFLMFCVKDVMNSKEKKTKYIIGSSHVDRKYKKKMNFKPLM